MKLDRITKMYYSMFILLVMLPQPALLGQSDSTDREVFPDDLFLEQHEMDMLNLSAPVIRNERLHFVMGYKPALSTTASQFKDRFGSPSTTRTMVAGLFLGAEYQWSQKLSVFAQFSIPQKLTSKYNSQDHGSTYDFVTKHELSYGSVLRGGVMFNMKRTSRWDFGIGLGGYVQNMNLKSSLLSDKNAISNSVIFVTKTNQSQSAMGLFGVAAFDFYVSRSVSIQMKFGLDMQKAAKFSSQEVIRRAQLYYSTFDYHWHTFDGIKSGGSSLILEIGTRWHL